MSSGYIATTERYIHGVSSVCHWGHRGRIVLGFKTTVQSVPITTNIMSLNPAQAGYIRYNIM